MDPRVKTPPADLKRQFDLAMKVVEMMNKSHSGALGGILTAIEEADAAPTPGMAAAVARRKKEQTRRSSRPLFTRHLHRFDNNPCTHR